MISFEHRILSEYRIKNAKIDTLVNSILSHSEPKGEEARGASDFLDILITESDNLYQKFSDILSKDGKRPHARSRLPENKKWNANVEEFYKRNPRRRPKN